MTTPSRSLRELGEIITPAEVAALLHVHVKTVYRLAERGLLPGHKIGRKWRFSTRSILDLLSPKAASTTADLRGGLHRDGG